MQIIRRITGTITRIAREVADAPRVHRELRQHRTAQAGPARTPAPLTADQVKGEVPEVADIEAAAQLYEQAKQQTNAGARLKRQAEKTLKHTPDGQYGQATVERFESSRQVADLDTIKAIFAEHGLGQVPMKRCAPSLTITWAVESTADAADLQLVAA